MSPDGNAIKPESEVHFNPKAIVAIGLVITFWPVITLFAIAGYMATKREQRRKKAPTS